MILKWLDTGVASWSSLVEALKSPLIDKRGLDYLDDPCKYITYINNWNCTLYNYKYICNYVFHCAEELNFSIRLRSCAISITYY